MSDVCLSVKPERLPICIYPTISTREKGKRGKIGFERPLEASKFRPSDNHLRCCELNWNPLPLDFSPSTLTFASNYLWRLGLIGLNHYPRGNNFHEIVEMHAKTRVILVPEWRRACRDTFHYTLIFRAVVQVVVGFWDMALEPRAPTRPSTCLFYLGKYNECYTIRRGR